MTHPSSLGRLLDTRSAHRLLATRSSLAITSDIETLVWGWLLANAEAQSAVSAAGGLTVIYETLASNPISETKALFEQMGLAWSPQTEAFLHNAAHSEGRYYSVFRDDAFKAANRWRQELDAETIEQVRRIVTRDAIGQMFFAS